MGPTHDHNNIPLPLDAMLFTCSIPPHFQWAVSVLLVFKCKPKAQPMGCILLRVIEFFNIYKFIVLAKNDMSLAVNSF